MRESVGTLWTYGLMIIFVMLFAAFLSLTIKYSRVFKVKNESLTIIAKYEGYNQTSRKIINDYLKTSGYSGTGQCPKTGNFYGETSLENSGSKIEKAVAGKKYLYCVKLDTVKDNYDQYSLILFFNFNLPVMGNIGSFNISGQTINIIHNSNGTILNK